MMRGVVVGFGLMAVVPAPSRAQQWAAPVVTRGDTMYTDLSGIEPVSPHVYRAWSKYVYAKAANQDAQALVQKEYDCKRISRRVISAVFYNADHAVTWRSNKPGPWTPITRKKGQKQWSAVCNRVEGGVVANFVSWLTIKLR